MQPRSLPNPMYARALPAPMLLHEGRRPLPFDQPGRIYELKFDAWRLVAGVQEGQAQLMTRKGATSSSFPGSYDAYDAYDSLLYRLSLVPVCFEPARCSVQNLDRPRPNLPIGNPGKEVVVAVA